MSATVSKEDWQPRDEEDEESVPECETEEYQKRLEEAVILLETAPEKLTKEQNLLLSGDYIFKVEGIPEHYLSPLRIRLSRAMDRLSRPRKEIKKPNP